MTAWEDDVGDLVDECNEVFGVSIAYQARGTRTLAADGTPTLTATTYNITAERGPATQAYMGDRPREESRVYIIRASDLPARPDPNDNITDNNVVWYVAAVDIENEGKAYRVRCIRKVG